MSDEWGPWIGWNGAIGEKPCESHVVVEFVNDHGYRGINKCGELWFDNIIAYRVKKEPAIKVTTHVFEHRITGDTYNAQCTYTDGKLTKIHWEAAQ